MANLTGIITARTLKLGEDFSKGCIYFSNQTHSSMAKGLRILGFRKDQMRVVPTTHRFTMKAEVLKEMILKDQEAGYRPFCIVGNAGTTNTGSVDPLIQLSEIAQTYGLWFHIDGAYGAAAILSEPYKQEIEGIGRADSLTLDPHKWWFQPFETGCLLVRDRSTLKRTFQVQAEYLEDTVGEGEEINFYDYGIQLTRSFRALKLYTYLRIHGLPHISQLITQGIRNAEIIEKILMQQPFWEVISPPSLGIVAFRAKVGEDEGLNDLLNKNLSDELSRSGLAMVTTTKLHGKVALRMCPIHPQTSQKDLEDTIKWMGDFVLKKR